MRPALPALTLFLVVVHPPGVRADGQCSHLGEAVVCPDGITPGSGSVNFTDDGILWSDGNTSLGFDVPLFVDAAPTSPLDEPAVPDPIGGGGTPVVDAGPSAPLDTPTVQQPGGGDIAPITSAGGSVDDMVETVADQLALTADPDDGGAGRGRPRQPAGFTWDDTMVVVDLWQQNNLGLAREFARADADTRLDIRQALYLPGWIDAAPLPGSREAILQKFRESGDIAGAAMALADGSIKYDQTTSQEISQTATRVTDAQSGAAFEDVRSRLGRQFIGIAGQDEVLHATRGNCYEFVHLAAWFAGAGRGQLNLSTGVEALIDSRTRQVWDGDSDIPAGQVVVGAVWNNDLQGGQDDYGFFHVGISLGGGWVVSNRGSGAQIERLEAVFGSNWYQNVYYGDYGGYELPASTREFLDDERGNFPDQFAAIDGDDSLNDAQKAHEKAILAERGQLIGYVLGEGPLPDRISPEGRAYQAYLAQLADGVGGDKAFFYTSFKDFSAAQARAPTPTAPAAPASAGQAPAEPPFGRETARLVADWFNLSEAGSLGVPAAGGQ